ncbi:glutathione S-transferase family protein [Sneathiella sp. HT1-7]|jgi:glutathione S-transferase|uniref:glutathione S-transferase family protein n=1 Tax=Sneathiella sp. HT1-7 TaxID=2887192 RepID=UPI001D14DC50|nr:glutathione S-transferase [Sneathiella sp. HT1-7]MCC3303218.1 glutathione S-transferase [Sneathiella sp. HT1-7]
MITVHHLNDSRSQRILWLLEELGVDYEVVRYERDATTRLAPDELKEIHPLGKSPVLVDGELRLHESGAITDYLIRTYGAGKFAPEPGSAEHEAYSEWLHYAEGSAMLPLLLRLYTSRLGDAAAPLMPRIDSETENHFFFMNNEMTGREYFVGSDLTGADIMMSFPLEAARARGILSAYPALAAFVERIQARPAYTRALEKGGHYSYGPAAD